jgi:hypothetical protein
MLSLEIIITLLSQAKVQLFKEKGLLKVGINKAIKHLLKMNIFYLKEPFLNRTETTPLTLYNTRLLSLIKVEANMNKKLKKSLK